VEACPQNKQSNRVVFVFKAAKRDPAWDFNKGDLVRATMCSVFTGWSEWVKRIGQGSLIPMAQSRLCP
jgi:hypothetical protein